jgi:hypothetical protein
MVFVVCFVLTFLVGIVILGIVETLVACFVSKPTIGEEQMSEVESTTKRQPRTIVRDPAFVLAFTRCSSYEEVSVQLGLGVASVMSRAARLRKAGVNLPKFDRVLAKKTSVEELNAILEQSTAN